jgi:hypothetical protein
MGRPRAVAVRLLVAPPARREAARSRAARSFPVRLATVFGSTASATISAVAETSSSQLALSRFRSPGRPSSTVSSLSEKRPFASVTVPRADSEWRKRGSIGPPSKDSARRRTSSEEPQPAGADHSSERGALS